MFNNISDFTAFYIPLGLLLFLMVAFKEPLLALENKIDEKIKGWKK
jgi:hypothetical protein